MPLTKFTVGVNNIQALSDLPNTADGLTSSELKQKFDKAGADIKYYINEILTEELDYNFTALRASEYPIGRIVMFYDNLDHSSYLGFTWERCMIGKSPIGLDLSDTDFNTIGNTGGEKTHTLTIDEMPSHNHKSTHYLDWYGGGGKKNIVGGDSNQLSTSNTGGGQAHNNLQPYEVVSFWKRVS